MKVQLEEFIFPKLTPEEEAFTAGYMAAENMWLEMGNPIIATRVLFVDYENGYSYRDPSYDFVLVHGEVTKEQLKEAESQQLGATRTGGSWIKALKTLNLDYSIISSGKLSKFTYQKDPFITFVLTTGNY